MPTEYSLRDALHMHENQLALEAALMEVALWIEQRGSDDAGENIRTALDLIGENAEHLKQRLARLTAQHREERATMTPDEIRAFLEREYPQLTAEVRTNPDGWSFFLGPAQRSANSNRILRAVRHTPDGATRLKLAVSSRVGPAKEFDFRGDEDELREHVEAELLLFRIHFGQP